MAGLASSLMVVHDIFKTNSTHCKPVNLLRCRKSLRVRLSRWCDASAASAPVSECSAADTGHFVLRSRGELLGGAQRTVSSPTSTSHCLQLCLCVSLSSLLPLPLTAPNSLSSPLPLPSHCLPHCPQLTLTISLSHNLVMPTQVLPLTICFYQVLSDTLTISKCLTDLNIAGNQLGLEGSSSVMRALCFNTCLTSLNMNNNAMGSDIAATIKKTLKLNQTLKKLHLAWNDLGHVGGTAVAKGVKVNTALVHLDLSHNSLGSTSGTSLEQVDSLHLCTHLYFLSSSPNYTLHHTV